MFRLQQDPHPNMTPPNALDSVREAALRFETGPAGVQPIVDAIRAVLGEGGAALGPAFQPGERSGEDDVVGRIRRILDDEVRPAVAMDGGDVVFAGFRDGIVELYLEGACSGCPSSTATLKAGIENMLRHYIPEVVEVRAVN